MGTKLPARTKPPKWVERVIICSTSGLVREEQLIDLRKRYRATLKSHGVKAADAMAAREALTWIQKVWGYHALFILKFVDLILGLINKFRGP